MFKKREKWRRILKKWVESDFDEARVTDVQPEAVAPSLCRWSRRGKWPVLAVFPSLDQAEEARWRLLRLEGVLKGDENCVVLPECVQGRRFMPEDEARRARALNDVLNGSVAMVVASVGGLLTPALDPSAFQTSSIHLRRGASIDFDELPKTLVELDYDDEVEVEAPGEFARRGGILDIFSPGSDWPVRIEFWGETIESLRLFSPETQRSIREVDEYDVTPRMGLNETALRADALAYFDDSWSVTLVYPEQTQAHIDRFFDQKRAQRWRDWLADRPMMNILRLLDSVESASESGKTIVSPCFSATSHVIESLPGDSDEETSRLFQKLFSDRVRQWLDTGYHVAFVAERKEALDPLMTWCGDFDVPLDRVELSVGDVPDALLFTDARLVLIPEKCVYVVLRGNKRRGVEWSREIIRERAAANETIEFMEGDHVVHFVHGVGVYHGVDVIRRHGVEREMIRLEYADEVTIHIPLRQIRLISRYVGAGRAAPSLSKIDGKRWRTAKLAAAESAGLLAADMLRLHAARVTNDGVAFPEDDSQQVAFEQSFPYDETPDQLKAAEEVRKDMTSPNPMDRLLCGDVGYGKTEVAMRAAFRAVMAGKQVAVLVPTTVLAQQHYYTFAERFAGHPIIIDTLSRFKRRSEQSVTLRRLAEGSVDVIIGTHRLVQTDVTFRDLGLVIIDEEQRFGVEHKERLKRLRLNVDVLTLTATPIPRTLHLSLAGIRDLSTIVTPPHRRTPVRTLVCQHDPDIVKAAIDRELERGGQVFYLHNRVKTIEKTREVLEDLVPDASFAETHGQMNERELERRMAAFIKGTIDVLVTTTIIESGLDIPNANTIIIERADRFGLAELYQLRGRVGRWNRQAHAYLLLPKREIITGDARERLAAIRKYTRLGVGLKLAIKDLEIRGAGTLLGREQSGHINSIGFDLYCQLLGSAAARIKNEPDPILHDVNVQFDFLEFAFNAPKGTATAAIPPDYVPAESTRLELHRRLEGMSTSEDVDSFEAELVDRFGALPDSVANLLTVRKLAVAAARIGLISISIVDNSLAAETSRGPYRENGFPIRLKGRTAKRKLFDALGLINEIRKN